MMTKTENYCSISHFQSNIHQFDCFFVFVQLKCFVGLAFDLVI